MLFFLEKVKVICEHILCLGCYVGLYSILTKILNPYSKFKEWEFFHQIISILIIGFLFVFAYFLLGDINYYTNKEIFSYFQDHLEYIDDEKNIDNSFPDEQNESLTLEDIFN